MAAHLEESDAPAEPEIVVGDAHGGGSHHGLRAVIAALVANLAIAVAKFTAFTFTGSSSMLAEAIHSVADSGNQGLLLLGARRSKKAANLDHPFGYGRERYFWGFVVALVLFSLGSLFAIYEGIHKLQHPEPIENPQWALGVLGFALIAEGLSFRTAVRESAKTKGDATYWQFIRRAKSPELPVVLLEDFGALIGLVLAMAGVSASVVTDDGIYDGLGSLAIGILLGIIAIVLVVEMKSLLIGESANRKDVEAICAAIEIDPDVIRVIHLRTEHLGPDELLVATKVEFQHELTVAEVAGTIDRVERSIRAGVPSARMIFIEPDVHDEHRARSFVTEHSSYLDPDDPHYAEIAGHDPEGDDSIWS